MILETLLVFLLATAFSKALLVVLVILSLVVLNNHPFGIGKQHAVANLIKNGQIVCIIRI